MSREAAIEAHADRIDHEAEAQELLLTYTNEGGEYNIHLTLARNNAGASAWATQADRLANRYNRQFGMAGPYTTATVLLFAVKLEAYYAEHIREG